MSKLLSGYDFAHVLTVGIHNDSSLYVPPGDLNLAGTRARLGEGTNFISLSAAGHSMDLYRRLPFGWRSAPPDIYTDLYMWQQILDVPSVRAVTSTRATLIHFPSPHRTDWSQRQRLEELQRWTADMDDPCFSTNFERRVLAYLAAERSRLDLVAAALAP